VGDDHLWEAVTFGPFTRFMHRASLPQLKQVDATSHTSLTFFEVFA
jgi:hypothetical protein